jgi:catechol 2,3-dioxygenase-like lactoylglutathione lyase family enzyme
MKMNAIKEICLYVNDLERTRDFYHELLELPLISYVEERHVFFRVGEQVLLCFLPEVTKEEEKLPPHFAHGPQHMAFEVPQHSYQAWKQKLRDAGVLVTHEQKWKAQKESFYFEDPSGNVLEILPPGIWE